LEIFRFDDEAIQVNRQVVRLVDVSESVIAEFQSVAANKGLILSRSLGNTIVTTDLILLVRMLQNLIDNAIKYTQQGSVLISESFETTNLCG
jgi:signal transduction histidine kinase